MHLIGFMLNHFGINVKLVRCCLCLSCQWPGSLVSRERKERRKISLDSGRMGLAEGFATIFPSSLLQLFPGSECQKAGSTALLQSLWHTNSLLCTGMHFLKKKKKDTREKCASKCVTESPDATSERPRPNSQLQEAFLGWGLWALCHPMVCSRSGHCCQPRCCVMFQACSGSKFLVSAVVFSYCICSTGAERKFVTYTPSCYKMEKLFKLHFDLSGEKNWKSYFNLEWFIKSSLQVKRMSSLLETIKWKR